MAPGDNRRGRETKNLIQLPKSMLTSVVAVLVVLCSVLRPAAVLAEPSDKNNYSELLKSAGELTVDFLRPKRHSVPNKQPAVQDYEVLERVKVATPGEREIVTRTLVDAINSGKTIPGTESESAAFMDDNSFHPVYAVTAQSHNEILSFLLDFSSLHIDKSQLLVVSGANAQTRVRRYEVISHYGNVFDVLFKIHDPTFLSRNKSTVYVATAEIKPGDAITPGTAMKWSMYNSYLTGHEAKALEFSRNPKCTNSIPHLSFVKDDQFTYELEHNTKSTMAVDSSVGGHAATDVEVVAAKELSQTELAFLKSADSIKLVPTHYGEAAPGQANINHFPAGSGRVLETPELRELVIENLRAALNNADMSALCFEPSFGIEAKRGVEVHNFLVCFSCYETIEYLHSGSNVKEVHYRTFGQYWPILQALLEAVPGYGDSDWYFSLAANRTINVGESIKESDIRSRWNFGQRQLQAPVHESDVTGTTDSVVTEIRYEQHPVCVETIVAGKKIYARQIKYEKSL
ncbi:MAG TPA: hypothetical protein V6C86_25035 [Oculatellaceae cyanobacterium]